MGKCCFQVQTKICQKKMKCNYNTKKLDNNISRFYSELLDYFSELRDQYRDDRFKGDLIIWNNQDITIEGKSLYWKKWRECGIYFVQDLKNTGKYLSYEEIKTKYNIEVNFIYYCQILSAIPKNLKVPITQKIVFHLVKSLS